MTRPRTIIRRVYILYKLVSHILHIIQRDRGAITIKYITASFEKKKQTSIPYILNVYNNIQYTCIFITLTVYIFYRLRLTSNVFVAYARAHGGIRPARQN